LVLTDKLAAPPPDRGRRWAIGACLAVPLVAGAALAARRVRAALVGAGGLADGRVEVSATGGFPRRLHGPAGEVWTLPRAPRRIVSTYLAADEILAALDVRDRIAGVSIFADDPAISNVRGVYPLSLPRLRGEVEGILAVEPDLVCVAGYSDADAMRQAIGARLPILRWSRFDSFADVFANVRLIGAAVGADAAAEALAANGEARLGELAARLEGVRPVRVLYLDPPNFTAGSHTLLDEILTRAGGVNVAAKAGISGAGPIGIDLGLSLDAEAIIAPAYPGAAPPLEALRATPLWRELGPVRAGRVNAVPAALPGDVSPHAVEAPFLVARALHPDRF
jgi:iron complex transport system substrate-binding protein